MWTNENRAKYKRDHLRYPSDLTDEEWAHVEPLIPPARRGALAKMLSRVKIEIVKRSDQAKGFVTLPKRWIVERSIAWLNRCRRLAKDWENLNVTALMFLRFASIRLMLRRLCNPA